MKITREMIGAAHDVCLKKGDFVLSADLLERLYLAMYERSHEKAESDELKADAMRYRWLPVEIVPKTEEILLVSHIFNNKICWAQAARQKHGVWFSPTGHAVHQPTHWMSLPKPPTLAKGESHES